MSLGRESLVVSLAPQRRGALRLNGVEVIYARGSWGMTQSGTQVLHSRISLAVG